MIPTRIRYLVLATTAIVAIFMYIDRVCLASASSGIQKELALSDKEMDWLKSAFFWTYALTQVPAAALAYRFGYRRILAIYLFLWSFFTAMTGLAQGFTLLILCRLAVGFTEAGAYPAAASIIKNWFPISSRGFASSMVALGGRVGFAGGLLLTPMLMANLDGYREYSGWRVSLMLFGVIGIAWSFVFWLIVRDSAKLHPLSNTAEAALVPPAPEQKAEPFPFWELLTSRNLWFSSITQFCVNVSWAILLTHFPDYLEKVHGLKGDEKGFWSSLPAMVGIAGMFFGGFLTDALSRRFGLRRGRSLILFFNLTMCALAYLSCAFTGSISYMYVVFALCVMTIFSDLGIPAIWAFAQDIGGKHAGAVLGWSNMWGNLGAAISPILLGIVRDSYGWSSVFVAGAVVFLIGALSASQMNATLPLVPEKVKVDEPKT